MQPHLEAHVDDLAGGVGQGVLAQRLTAGQHDAVEQPPPAAQQGAHLLPGHLAGRAGRDEVLVVAVEAVPGAALQEDGRGQVVGPVDSAHGDEPGNHQVVSRAVVRGSPPPPERVGRPASLSAGSSRLLLSRLVVMAPGRQAPSPDHPTAPDDPADPQALTALRRETAGPWPPAATSVNICRSMYSPFLPMLNDRTGRK